MFLHNFACGHDRSWWVYYLQGSLGGGEEKRRRFCFTINHFCFGTIFRSKSSMEKSSDVNLGSDTEFCLLFDSLQLQYFDFGFYMCINLLQIPCLNVHSEYIFPVFHVINFNFKLKENKQKQLFFFSIFCVVIISRFCITFYGWRNLK